MVKCEWCDCIFDNLNALSNHITKKHKGLCKLYYDMFILDNYYDKFCICGKEKKYKHGLSGYYKNCGNNKCRKTLQNITTRKTLKKIYGSETYRNIKLNKETKKKRYGDENYNNREKAEQTCKIKYGVHNPNQSDKIRNKIKNTCEKIYGGIAPACDKKVQNKMKKTCKTKYGNNFYIVSEEGIKTRNKRMKELYGTINALQNETILKSMREKNKEKYGYEWPCQQPHFQQKVKKKYNYDNLTFDSKLEIEFYKFLKENNINFTYQPEISFEFEYDNKIRYYHPDFIVNDIICETKGIHFFKNKNTNNVMVCPYHKKNDTPEKIEWRNGLYEAKHQCMIKNNVKILTNKKEFQFILEKELGLTNK